MGEIELLRREIAEAVTDCHDSALLDLVLKLLLASEG